MKKTTTLLLAAASAVLLTSCATQPRPVAPGYANDSDDFDNDIPKNEVPANVLAAAKAQIPGFVLEKANLQQRGATRLFELQGRANDRPYELDITADGRVLHIERD
jgi:starvation-inducible outer membrane lipoprotein